MVLVGSTIHIVDQDAPILELKAKENLLFTSSNWWDKFPFFRDTSDFETYSEEKIFQERQFLSQYFKNLGYLDVEIKAMTVFYEGKGLKKGPKDKRSFVVDYTVNLGSLWYVDEILISGLTEELTLEFLPNKSKVFSRVLQDEIENEILERLRKKRYKNVSVTWQFRKTRDHHIILEAIVDVKNKLQFGRIEFRSWDGRMYKPFIPEYEWFGEEYDSQKLQSLEERLYSLSLYEALEIDEIVDYDQEKVDVLVRLKTIDPWRVDPIVRVTSESTTWATDIGLQWKFRAEEFSLSGKHQIGYRNYPRIQNFDFSHQGLATWQELEISRPIFSSLTGEWFLKTEGIADAQVGFQEALAKGALGLRWKPKINWSLETAFSWQQHYYFPMVGKEEMFHRWFGETGLVEEVRQPEISLSLEYLKPKRVWVNFEIIPLAWCNHSRLSFYYFRSEVKKKYGAWTLRPRLQQGAIIWYDDPVNSLHNRFFLGGAQTVRGWLYRAIKRPRDESEIFDVSRGGERMGMLSLELQYEIIPAVSTLSFFDLGRVWGLPTYGEDEINNLPTFLPSIGAGVLLPSPAGDLVLAPTWQLIEPDLKHAPSRMVLHVYVSREFGQ